MKAIVFGSIDGNLDIVNKILKNHDEVSIGICLGDMCLASVSTELKYFIRSKFKFQSEKFIEFNDKSFWFQKPVYCLYGSLDDPFIPSNELKIGNFFPLWGSCIRFLAYSEDRTKSITRDVGFLSGYYNKEYNKKTNTYRSKMSRERKSLSLCKNDFEVFKNNNIDIMFCHDSPLGFPEDKDVQKGSQDLKSLLDNKDIKLLFSGHHRIDKEESYKNTKIIHVPNINDKYYIVDLYDLSYTKWDVLSFIN